MNLVDISQMLDKTGQNAGKHSIKVGIKLVNTWLALGKHATQPGQELGKH